MRARAWVWMLGVVPLVAACEETTTPPVDAAHDHPVVDASPDVHASHDAQHDVDDAAVDVGSAEDVAPDVADVPTPCTPLRARALGTGWNHALAIDPGGVLSAWGANGSGQLGLGEHGDRARAHRALEGGVWRTVVGGSRHSCGIREDGSLWCWGTNVHGQLGVGDTADRMRPTRVGDAADWVEVACGGLHSCGVRQGGTLWCWGANPAGQLGLGMRTGDQLRPQRVGTESGWRGLAAKARYNCALRPEGALWCWGDNSDGQLGVGDTADRIAPIAVMPAARWAQVAMGPLHTCGIDDGGALWCWGLNDFGQLGLGNTADQRSPQRVGSDTDWRAVAGGFEHTCGLRGDGALYCWGNNALAQLGVAGAPTRDTPTRVTAMDGAVTAVVTGQGHTCVRGPEDRVWCWGDNISGQAGADDRSGPRTAPGDVCVGP